mmetsp:Transcript_12308/g.15901  ORF Transcript_12308/g.15901 Transcript_12308/m.15901 type:complete len:185 (-) Transcript_12308:2334-2888(-)
MIGQLDSLTSLAYLAVFLYSYQIATTYHFITTRSNNKKMYTYVCPLCFGLLEEPVEVTPCFRCLFSNTLPLPEVEINESLFEGSDVDENEIDIGAEPVTWEQFQNDLADQQDGTCLTPEMDITRHGGRSRMEESRLPSYVPTFGGGVRPLTEEEQRTNELMTILGVSVIDVIAEDEEENSLASQ